MAILENILDIMDKKLNAFPEKDQPKKLMKDLTD